MLPDKFIRSGGILCGLLLGGTFFRKVLVYAFIVLIPMWFRVRQTRSEFRDGQMFAMDGGSINHSLLACSIGALLDRQVPQGCRTFNSGLRIQVAPPDYTPMPTASSFAASPNSLAISRM
jgi:hypothetical protein